MTNSRSFFFKGKSYYARMNILAIETSCDETAISIVCAAENNGQTKFDILSHIVLSQAQKHAEYGGVFPALAKREHTLNLTPILRQALEEANLAEPSQQPMPAVKRENIATILDREGVLFEQLYPFLNSITKPNIDHIVVTSGPGLEPALWVGVNLAKALGAAWDIPIYPINHMEGHVYSALPIFGEDQKNFIIPKMEFPILALLISGGHTELVLMNDWLHYKILGKTKDDAVGEAFDKVARILDLTYPGGPHVSKIADQGATNKDVSLPRPMINSKDYDFSFSGLKTAVLYLTKKMIEKGHTLTDQVKADIALEFELATTEVLVKKTLKAVEEYGAKALIIAGGVAANKRIRNTFTQKLETDYDIPLLLPKMHLTGDNSLMIAIAGYFRIVSGQRPMADFKANGNLEL